MLDKSLGRKLSTLMNDLDRSLAREGTSKAADQWLPHRNNKTHGETQEF